jgi:membrane dipeptidase
MVEGLPNARLPAELLASALRIQAEGSGVDAHVDTLQRVLYEGVDLRQELRDGHVDLPRLRKVGVGVAFFAMWVPPYYQGAEAVRRTLDFFDVLFGVLEAAQDQLELARSWLDVEGARRRGKIAALVTVEGGHQIGNDLAVLRIYHRLGARSMTLTHSRSHDWADSSTDAPRHHGLTPFGEQVIDEMNRLGMIVDVAHASDQTFFHVLRVARKPLIASHSGCRSVANVPRNLSDEMLRSLADNGGVICINFHSPHLNPGDAALAAQATSDAEPASNLSGKALDEWAAQQHRRIVARHLLSSATIDDVVAHIDHAVRIAGVESVGIGSDYDGGIVPPRGLEDVSARPMLIAALLARGYRDEVIQKIMGGNVLRIVRSNMTA